MDLDFLIPLIPDAGQMDAYGQGLRFTGKLLIYIGGILVLLF